MRLPFCTPKDNETRLRERLQGINDVVVIHVTTWDYVTRGVLPGDTLIWHGDQQRLAQYVEFGNV